MVNAARGCVWPHAEPRVAVGLCRRPSNRQARPATRSTATDLKGTQDHLERTFGRETRDGVTGCVGGSLDGMPKSRVYGLKPVARRGPRVPRPPEQTLTVLPERVGRGHHVDWAQLSASFEYRPAETRLAAQALDSIPIPGIDRASADVVVHGWRPLDGDGWWSGRGSNPRPSHCERDALPTELPPHARRAILAPEGSPSNRDALRHPGGWEAGTRGACAGTAHPGS